MASHVMLHIDSLSTIANISKIEEHMGVLFSIPTVFFLNFWNDGDFGKRVLYKPWLGDRSLVYEYRLYLNDCSPMVFVLQMYLNNYSLDYNNIITIINIIKILNTINRSVYPVLYLYGLVDSNPWFKLLNLQIFYCMYIIFRWK